MIISDDISGLIERQHEEIWHQFFFFLSPWKLFFPFLGSSFINGLVIKFGNGSGYADTVI